MKTYLSKAAFCILLANTIGLTLAGQQSVKLIPAESRITIKGTSNLHDWEENVGNFNVSLSLKIINSEIQGIENVRLVCKSNSIASEYAIMTNKTMEALKTDKYPDIVFTMESVENLKSVSEKSSGTVTGYLTLAGSTQRIRVVFNGQVSNNRIVISGNKDINMNDFKIKPPTAILGTLKTDETVVISFQLCFRLA
jgi:polyisoprenoid-binding protein YceI